MSDRQIIISEKLQKLAAEHKEVWRHLTQVAASGDAVMELISLQKQMADEFFATNGDSLVGLECRLITAGKMDKYILDVTQEHGQFVPMGSIWAQREPFGCVAHRANFAYKIAGEWIRLFFPETL